MLVATTYLHQRHPADLRPAPAPDEPVAVVLLEHAAGDLIRALYHLIGRAHRWTGRRSWSSPDWDRQRAQPHCETWVIHYRRAHIGFAELLATDDGEVHINYLGLMRAYRGRGLGGHLLTEVTRHAWRMHERVPAVAPVHRVALDTCSLDGHHALANYLARGYRVEKAQTVERTIPAPREPVDVTAMRTGSGRG